MSDMRRFVSRYPILWLLFLAALMALLTLFGAARSGTLAGEADACGDPATYTVDVKALSRCRPVYDPGDLDAARPGDPRVLICFQFRAGLLPPGDLENYDPCADLERRLHAAHGDIPAATQGALSLWASLAYAELPVPQGSELWGRGGPVAAAMSEASWAEIVETPRAQGLAPVFDGLAPGTWQSAALEAGPAVVALRPDGTPEWTVEGELHVMRRRGLYTSMDVQGASPAGPLEARRRISFRAFGRYDPAMVSEINLVGAVIERVELRGE